MDRDLLRHELAHCFGGILGGASTATISHDGRSWRTDHEWPMKQPPEEAVLLAYLSGMGFPGCASAEDRMIAAMVPEQVRQAVMRRVMAEVVPMVMDLSDAELDRMVRCLNDTGSLAIRRPLN